MISNSKLRRLAAKPYDTRSAYQSKVDKNKLYVGHLAGLILLEYNNGEWIDKGDILGKKYTIESIVEDKNGNLWLGTGLNGIIKVEKDKVIEYDLSKGLPALDKNKVYCVENEIIITTRQGLYYYDQTNDTIIKYKGFGEEFYKRTDLISGIYVENDSVYWFLSKYSDKKNIGNSIEYIERVVKNNDTITIDKLPFNRIKKFGFQSITPVSDGSAWFSSSTEAIYYNPKIIVDDSYNYHSLVRKVNITVDSVIFWGANYNDTSNLTISVKQPEYLKTVQDFTHNNITFYFSSPYFPTEELKFRYKLEGFEEEWSNWATKNDKEYTNLNEGTYIFKVEAQNIYGIQSEVAEYSFSILPPWYRTVWALILYILAAIGVIVITVKLYTRKLQLEKIRLEQIVKERTEEVVKQKDEILLQRDEIAEKNKSITDSIEYAKRIQTAVLPSKEFEDEVLPEHFILFRPRDIVSGDFYWFTKKLARGARLAPMAVLALGKLGGRGILVREQSRPRVRLRRWPRRARGDDPLRPAARARARHPPRGGPALRGGHAAPPERPEGHAGLVPGGLEAVSPVRGAALRRRALRRGRRQRADRRQSRARAAARDGGTPLRL